MTLLLRTYCRFIDAINKAIGTIAGWLTSAIVAVIFIDVVMRYLFNTGAVVIQELQWHMFAAIIMLGAGATLLKDAHVRVDIFYQKLSPKGQAWVNFSGSVLMLFPSCILIIITSLPFVENAYNFSEGSPDPGGLPYRFALKGLIPFGFSLVLLQGTCLAIRSLYIILDKDLGE